MIFGYFDAKTYREFFTIHVQIIEHRYVRANELIMVVNIYIFDKHGSEQVFHTNYFSNIRIYIYIDYR
jgi:hypothetical protein